MSDAADQGPVRITAPLDDATIAKLHAGDRVLLSGTVLAARDTVHLLLVQALHDNKELPVDLQGQVMYYVGPTPARPGAVIGAAGPTTSSRMDPYTPTLLGHGLKGMIGKGPRGESVKKAIAKHQAVYFAAIGGAGALIAQSIVSAEVIAYPRLGPEALRRLEVKDFPLIVANDMYGADLYEQGMRAYAVEESGT